MPDAISLDLETASDQELLAESDEEIVESSVLEGRDFKRADAEVKPAESPVEGLALLLQDLRWVYGILLSAAARLAPFLQMIHSDILTWAIAFVSFSLTRSMLVPILTSNGQKVAEPDCDEDEEDEDDEEEYAEEEAGSEKDQELPRKQDLALIKEKIEKQKADEEWEELEKRKKMMNTVQKDARDVFGCTALHLAAHNCFTEDVQQLLDMGFNPNIRDKSKETPLHMAARAGCMETARTLLAGKADPFICNAFGTTPVAIAMHSNKALAEFLRGASRNAN